MINYGYTSNNIKTTQPFKPHKLDKIKLTPSRPKFIVSGTRDSIFDWMKCYENLICETTSLRLDHTTKNEFGISSMKKVDQILKFELYDDEEQHHDEDDKEQHHGRKIISIIKPLFSSGTKKYNGSSKMRLEISVSDYTLHTSRHDHSPTPIMETEVINGTKLLHVFNDLQDQLNREQLKKSYDYELL